MLGAAESPLGDREGGAIAIFEKSGSPDSADPADFCNKIGPTQKSGDLRFRGAIRDITDSYGDSDV